jgi:hypothetical protein
MPPLFIGETVKGHDFIPQGDEAFLDWSGDFVTLVAANAAAWEVPQATAAALQTQFAGCEAKLVIFPAS